MKVFSALLALTFFIFVFPVKADYTTAYNDYTYDFSKYRDAYNEYQVAKSTYTTYKTLTSQAEAIKQLKNVVQARDRVMSSYYDLIQEKLLVTAGITQGQKNTFFKMKESEKTWMIDHQKKIDAAGTLDDLNTASSDFESHYPQMDFETKQAIGMILLSKEDGVISRWDISATNISNKLKEINLAGISTDVGERGVISARNKKELASTKIATAREQFSGKNGSRIELFEAQQTLMDANQYLREGISYLLEIIKSITG